MQNSPSKNKKNTPAKAGQVTQSPNLNTKKPTWVQAALAATFNKFKKQAPVDEPSGRTGENRFTSPSGMGGIRLPDGTNGSLAIRYDDVSYETYDKVRFYPVLRDCINVYVSAVARAGCHFVSSNDKAVQLANVLVKPFIRGLNENLMRGGLQFGNQVAEKVEKYYFNIKTSTTQSDAGVSCYEFPYAVGFEKFLYFDPSDTILIIDNNTGDFAGIKQYVPAKEGKTDIPSRHLLHYVNDREFDSVYGFAQTKSAIPFVKLAERLYDDMARWADMFGAPYKIGKFRPGFTPTGMTDANGVPIRVDNKDLMLQILEALESGASVGLASEFTPEGNQPYWGIDLLQCSGDGAEHYVDMIKQCNNEIRTGFGLAAYASSEAPDKGTFSLGKSMIDLFLRQVNSRLDGLKEVYDHQLLKPWNEKNFGQDAPLITIEFEPPDMDPGMMLMTAMVQAATAGVPLVDGNGNQILPDYSYLMQQMGIPFTSSKPLLVKEDPNAQQTISGEPTISTGA